MQAGTRGLQGFKGDKGDPGNDYEPMIGNVETLDPSLPATVSSNFDEEQNVVYFNFGIPKGDKGDKGDVGNVDMATFDVVDGKLIMNGTRQRQEIGDNFTFQLDDNKLEVVY